MSEKKCDAKKFGLQGLQELLIHIRIVFWFERDNMFYLKPPYLENQNSEQIIKAYIFLKKKGKEKRSEVGSVKLLKTFF